MQTRKGLCMWEVFLTTSCLRSKYLWDGAHTSKLYAVGDNLIGTFLFDSNTKTSH